MEVKFSIYLNKCVFVMDIIALYLETAIGSIAKRRFVNALIRLKMMEKKAKTDRSVMMNFKQYAKLAYGK